MLPPNAKIDDGKEKKDSYIPTIISLILLLAGIALDYFGTEWFSGYIRLLIFGISYLLVGARVIKYALTNIAKGDVFNEFFLMSIATLGAFYIGEYAEGVAVMLFYVIGEHFQEAAVARSRRSIKALIDNRPEEVGLVKDGQVVTANPQTVGIGEIIQIKVGEKVALDGEIQGNGSSFNTAALTGESKPASKTKGEMVLAGMINLEKVVEIKVTSAYEDSALSKILHLVEEASGQKAKTQKFITKFAKIYTPIVVFMAIALTLLPFFFVENYIFNDWLYRALVFLVISCPCALVISIPLGYFGGIGAASKNGMLFKGANFLDLITEVNTVVMDKTGTLTEGVFKVQEVEVQEMDENKFIALTAALEAKSTHPIAKAIVEFFGDSHIRETVSEVEEIAGHGLRGKWENKEVLVGNTKLLQKYDVTFPTRITEIVESIVVVAIDGKYAGYITIADKIKEDGPSAIAKLREYGIKTIVMLSGDKDTIVQKVAKELKIDMAFGGLLPQDKVTRVKDLKAQGKKVAFVGDGINDAPVITLADVGFAMGALGSDAAIETADVVIQTDQPSKIATAIKIGKKTKQVVWQNIILAFGVKALVLAFGAFGVASLWEAVFADVGVACLAILNAIRIQRMRF
ncbi:heavy metal translocating P-type ATPase [Salegentibacter salegens]|uniref:P-type Zn(2+) transporter n=1 Tax=Salegentibacter salegens TaxID=143223 RepID=A0A1M7I6B4_9FLAO|nr:heavy metal translocating P-type ATPase [Salegentibacter salegens]PRX47959.1 Cd2+/Zn2+-exporting ATPase [Salegentibacter salegens]SHM36188.1 Cd2+/Zn2+-exporting ATPase [Salegentibacter salegens]